MADIFPAGTESIRNLTPKFNYFLVVKGDSIADDIPQKEYFVYRFKVAISAKDGISELKKYFRFTLNSQVFTCRELSDIEYATGDFYHPDYKNHKKEPIAFKLREIPIYMQSVIRVIDFNKDPYQYGSKPIIKDNTSFIT
jgi:hypothetical protein